MQLTLAPLGVIVIYDCRLGKSLMRCAVTSRAGQVLANGYLYVEPDELGNLCLVLKTDGGRLIQGGVIGEDGNLTNASRVLFRRFFDVWGMSDVTLTASVS